MRLRGHFFPFTEPRVEVDVSCFNCKDGYLQATARAATSARARAGSRSSAPARSTQRLRLRRRRPLRPREGPGLRLGHGHRAHRVAQARRRRPAPLLRQRPSLPGAVRLMRVPLEWLHDYVDPGLPLRELEERLTMSGTEVEAIHHHGVGTPETFVVGKVLTRRAAPRRRPPARLHGRRRRGRAVADRLRRAERRGRPDRRGRAARLRSCPTARSSSKAKLRGVESAGMILAEDELGVGTDHGGIMVLDDALAAGHAAGRRPARSRTDVLELRDHAQPARLPRRLRRRPRGPRRDRRRAGAAAVG